MGSPLGMRGPRLDIFFLPGATHRFIRTQFSAGTDLDWMLEWDVEDGDDGFYKIAVEPWNDRDVKDPYLLTRVLLAAGVAGEALPGASRSASLSRRAQQPSSRRSA
ncbi:hypothetical protein [Belnapia moabensis]|uniref:hypothetical protein n=1 Tax=Belnapia moabensis TaxID=365533 RepID=UPI0012ED259C|nr:hypothetical protein [Belnapia moabensis]